MSGETAAQICQRWGLPDISEEEHCRNDTHRRNFMITLLFNLLGRVFLPIQQVLLKLKDGYLEPCYICKIDGTVTVVMFGKMMSCLWRVGTIDDEGNITWMHQDTENEIKGKVGEERRKAIETHVTNMCATVKTYLKHDAPAGCVDIWMKYHS
jgi:hypothetical protein